MVKEGKQKLFINKFKIFSAKSLAEKSDWAIEDKGDLEGKNPFTLRKQAKKMNNLKELKKEDNNFQKREKELNKNKDIKEKNSNKTHDKKNNESEEKGKGKKNEIKSFKKVKNQKLEGDKKGLSKTL